MDRLFCHSARRGFVYSLLLLALWLLALCGNVCWAADGPSVVLRLPKSLIPNPNALDIAAKANRRILAAFLEENPDITVEAATGLTIEGDPSNSSLMMSIASGNPPVVLSNSFKGAGTWTQQGFMLPMEQYVPDLPAFLSKIQPAIRPVIYHEGPPDGKKHLYYVPLGQMSAMVLLYRKDLFARSGLDPNKPPTTWDEFYADAKAMTHPDKGEYGFGIYQQGGGAAWQFTNFIYQAGGRLVEQTPDGKWEATYNSPAGVEALKFYHKLLRGEWTRNGKTYHGVTKRGEGSDLFPLFSQGRLGMVIDSLSGELAVPGRAQENPELVGFAPLPRGPGNQAATMINAELLGLCATVNNPQALKAGWRFIQFITSDKAFRIRTDLYVKAGFAQYVDPIYLRRFGYADEIKKVNPAFVAVQEQAAASGVPEPYGPNCMTIYDELGGVLDQVALSDDVNYQAAMDAAANHTNTELLGHVDPVVMRHRRMIVLAVVVACILMMIWGLWRIIRVFREPNGGASQLNRHAAGQRERWRKIMLAWTFMSVALASVLVWQYYPVIRGLVMAFQDYHLAMPSKFIGVDNFVEVFWSTTFWTSVRNTIFYVILTLGLGFVAPIILALFLDELPRGSLFFRIVFYLPTITSPLVIMMMWKQFYAPDSSGLFNQILALIGSALRSLGVLPDVQQWFMTPKLWLQSPSMAMLCIIIPGIWGSAGVGAILYLAALKNVPNELYEAASIDGASLWIKLRHVTIPTLRVLLIINFVGAFIGAFQASDRILVMTGGGPMNATRVLGLEVFYNAFVYLKYGYATAVAWILGSVLIGFTVYQLKILRNVQFSTAKRL